MMDWTDRHCRASHRLMRCRALYTEMVASAALVGLNRSDLCRGDRSCSIISVPGSAVTKRASGVPSGIFVHQDYRVVWHRKELSTSDGHHQRMSVSVVAPPRFEPTTYSFRTIVCPAARNFPYPT